LNLIGVLYFNERKKKEGAIDFFWGGLAKPQLN
jgi:hypothetical protein